MAYAVLPNRAAYMGSSRAQLCRVSLSQGGRAANLKSGASRRALVVSGSAGLPLYTTEPGDTLDKVARAHHTTVQDLMQANGARYLRSIGAPGGQLEQGRALFLRKVPGVTSPAAMHSQTPALAESQKKHGGVTSLAQQAKREAEAKARAEKEARSKALEAKAQAQKEAMAAAQKKADARSARAEQKAQEERQAAGRAARTEARKEEGACAGGGCSMETVKQPSKPVPTADSPNPTQAKYELLHTRTVDVAAIKAMHSRPGGVGASLNKDLVLMVGAPWCKYCDYMKPAYDQLALGLQHDKSVVVAYLRGDVDRDFSGQLGVRTFPTVLAFPKSGGAPFVYGSLDRRTESLLRFANYVCRSAPSAHQLQLQYSNTTAPPPAARTSSSATAVVSSVVPVAGRVAVGAVGAVACSAIVCGLVVLRRIKSRPPARTEGAAGAVWGGAETQQLVWAREDKARAALQAQQQQTKALLRTVEQEILEIAKLLVSMMKVSFVLHVLSIQRRWDSFWCKIQGARSPPKVSQIPPSFETHDAQPKMVKGGILDAQVTSLSKSRPEASDSSTDDESNSHPESSEMQLS